VRKSPNFPVFLPAIFMTLIVIVLSFAKAEEQYAETAPGYYERNGILPSNHSKGVNVFAWIASRDVPLSESYANSHAMRTIGGVNFLAEAAPSPDLSNKCPALSISADQPNGRRLRVVFSPTTSVQGTIYDWELAPLVDFIVSDEDGLFTYLESEAQYNKAFRNNLVGFNLFLLDNARRNDNFTGSHIMFRPGFTVPGYPQTEPTAEANQVWKKVRDKLLAGPRVMFYDRDVNFVFSIDNNNLRISGEPYWAVFVGPRERRDERKFLMDLRSEIADVRKTNPTIYDSMARIAKYSAFFKYVKRKCSTEWASFLKNFGENRVVLKEILFRPEQMPIAIK